MFAGYKSPAAILKFGFSVDVFLGKDIEVNQLTVQVETLREVISTQQRLGGGGFNFFPPLLGEMIQFGEYVFRWVETTKANNSQDPFVDASRKVGGSVCSWLLRWRAQRMSFSCCWMSQRITWMRRRHKIGKE